MPFIIQGNTTNLPTEPFLHNDKHYVALREVLQELGGTVDFDNTAKVATATIGPWSAQVEMGNQNVTVNGNGQSVPVTLTAPPYVDDNQMFVPFDFFRDVYGYNVSFSGDTVTITNPNA
jgi:hypothetical protein